METKYTGTVVWFNAKKGYGFVKPDDALEEIDIFVHWSGLVMEGFKQLKPGEKVQYVVKDTPKGVVAVEVSILNS